SQTKALFTCMTRHRSYSDESARLTRSPSSGNLLGCMRSKVVSQDRNMPLSCGNMELRGLEPLASCMPSTGSTSIAVRLCRSRSSHVHVGTCGSGSVAVLSRCTGQPARPGPNEHLTSGNTQELYRGASQGDQHLVPLQSPATCRRAAPASAASHCLFPR